MYDYKDETRNVIIESRLVAIQSACTNQFLWNKGITDITLEW